MNPQTANVLFIAAMFVVFYFLIVRPQQKRAAAQKAMLAAIKVGDEVVTVGGVFVTVVTVGERLRVRTVDGSELEMAPQAVGQIVPAKVSDEPEA